MNTPPRIAAIPTTYKGTKFRSKLEAAWAEWFDSNGIEWLYEQEGYQLPSGTWYLPDFFLPRAKTFVEVKGLLDESVEKPIELANSVPNDVVLAEAPAGVKYKNLSKHGDNNINVFYDKPNKPLCREWVRVSDDLTEGSVRCCKPVIYRVENLRWEGTVCEKCLFSTITYSIGKYDKDGLSLKINGIPLRNSIPPFLFELCLLYSKYEYGDEYIYGGLEDFYNYVDNCRSEIRQSFYKFTPIVPKIMWPFTYQDTSPVLDVGEALPGRLAFKTPKRPPQFKFKRAPRSSTGRTI